MNPTTCYQLGRYKLTSLHEQARRDSLASAARRARRARRQPSRLPRPRPRAVAARRLLAALGTRGQ
jgi:hypothetical protein